MLHTRATTRLFQLTFVPKCLVLNSKLINRQTPESIELLPHTVWENTTQNGSKGGRMALAPKFQRGSRQPKNLDPSVHAADSLLGKITGHFLLQLLVHGETTENPMHPVLLKNLDLTRSPRQAWHPNTGQALPGTHPHTASDIPQCHPVFPAVLLGFGEAACIQKMPPNTAGTSTALPERDYSTVS